MLERHELYKPDDNDLLRRFETFLKGGPRKVVPEESIRSLRKHATDSSPVEGSGELARGTAVVIENLTARPELNGQKGIVLRFDEHSSRYEVLMGSEIKRVRRGNLQCVSTASDEHPEFGPQAPCFQEEEQEDEVLECNLDEFYTPHVLDAQGPLRTNEERMQATPDNAGSIPRTADPCVHNAQKNNKMRTGKLAGIVEKLDDSQYEERDAGAGLSDELRAAPDMSSILTLCEQNLGLVDTFLALELMAQCPDRGVMRADRRLSGLLVRLCGLLDEASAKNCVDTLAAAVSLDLRSVSLLEALGTRTRHHLDQLEVPQLVQCVSQFASLGYSDVSFFDALGEQCLKRHSELSASQVVTIVDGFNVAHLHNWDMVDEFALQIAPQLERLSTEELVKCFEAFIRQNALLGDFVPKMESEIASRASSLKPAEAACVARAFALNIATPTTVISPLPDMLASFVNVQVEPLGLAEWAAFQDALPARHCEPLLSRAREAGAALSSMSSFGDDAVRTLHGLDVGNLGLVGTQRMLAEVGVRSCGLEFVRCALNRVSWASAAESWEVRTVRARSYAFVRFGLKGATEVRGDFVLSNTCVSSEESALLPLLSRGDARFCLLCQALSNFWDRAHSILDGTTVSGGVEVFLTDLPTEAAGFLAIRKMMHLLPGVTVALAMRHAEDPTDSPDDSSDEVLDVDLGEEVEIVD